MSCTEPPQDPGQLTIALLGKNHNFLRTIENLIFRGTDDSVTNMSNFVQRENDSFRVISNPKFFDEECHDPDQLIIDFMALSDPGPHQFVLAIDSQSSQEHEVVDQIVKLRDIFGKNVTKHVVIIFENQESYNLFKDLKKMFKIQMETVNENLAVCCKAWCSHRQTFQFEDKICSQDAVKKRKNDLKHTRKTALPPHNPGSTGACYQSPSSSQTFIPPLEKAPVHDKGESAHGEMDDDVLNIILLGQTGTGKSASGNTILTAGKPRGDPGQCFESKPSSTPVTKNCEVKMVTISGMKVRVVDTPDFFYEEEPSREELEECKKYCQPGQCLVLLVIQLGRFTDGEIELLEKLEKMLGWRIRDNTIVLFTHGDSKGTLEQFIYERTPLRKIVEACGHRYHVFKNKSKDSKQVMALFEKFRNEMSLKFPSHAQCCVC